FFFFFQAEDGIRDFHVTGVQTCALPISLHPRRFGSTSPVHWLRRTLLGTAYLRCILCRLHQPPGTPRVWIFRRCTMCVPRWPSRSEERRVGKECRYRVCGGH